MQFQDTFSSTFTFYLFIIISSLLCCVVYTMSFLVFKMFLFFNFLNVHFPIMFHCMLICPCLSVCRLSVYMDLVVWIKLDRSTMLCKCVCLLVCLSLCLCAIIISCVKISAKVVWILLKFCGEVGRVPGRKELEFYGDPVLSWILDRLPGFSTIRKQSGNWHIAVHLSKLWTDLDDFFLDWWGVIGGQISYILVVVR